MQVTINNQKHDLTLPYPPHLLALLETCVPGLKVKGIAVALNDQVIPRSQWSETIITDHADILIITATQGG